MSLTELFSKVGRKGTLEVSNHNVASLPNDTLEMQDEIFIQLKNSYDELYSFVKFLSNNGANFKGNESDFEVNWDKVYRGKNVKINIVVQKEEHIPTLKFTGSDNPMTNLSEADPDELL